MKAKVLKDCMIEVKAGQVIELSEKQFALAEKLGFAQLIVEEKPKKKSSK